MAVSAPGAVTGVSGERHSLTESIPRNLSIDPMNSHSKTLAVGLLLGAAALPASAVEFSFYKLGRGAGDFLPTDGVAATGGDLASSNVGGGVFNGDLTFVSGGITAVATATYNGSVAAVVQDHEPAWSATTGAGLGVYHEVPVNNSDDNITSLESLTITFDRVVRIDSLQLRSEGHNYTSWAANSFFRFDGAEVALPLNVGSIDGPWIGQSFTFAFNDAPTAGRVGDQFYLAALTVTAVPDTGSVLALMGLGLLGVGAIRRRF